MNEISRRVSSSSSLLFLLLPSHATACVGDVHARCSIFFLAAELCSISESFQAARRKKLKDKLAQYKLRVELVRLVLLCFCRSACVHPSTHVHACILCMRACVHVGRKVQGVFFFCVMYLHASSVNVCCDMCMRVLPLPHSLTHRTRNGRRWRSRWSKKRT